MLRSPLNEGGSGRPSHRSSAAAARIPPGTHSGRSALSRSITKPVWAEAHVSELAALRALAYVLRKLLRVERLHRAVLALDARHHERFAVGHRNICQKILSRRRVSWTPKPAVRSLRHYS